MEPNIITRLIEIAQTDIEESAECSVNNWLANLPSSASIDITTLDGSSQTLSISSAIASLDSVPRPWKVCIDIASDKSEIDETIGIPIDAVITTIDNAINLYISSLNTAAISCKNLYIYIRRLDAAYTWASLMPNTMCDSSNEVHRQLKNYITNVSNNADIHNTMSTYGHAINKCELIKGFITKIHSLSNVINDGPITDNKELTFVETDISGGTTLSELKVSNFIPCIKCEYNNGSYAAIPCGHIFCSTCIPINNESTCPACLEIIINKVKLSYQ